MQVCQKMLLILFSRTNVDEIDLMSQFHQHANVQLLLAQIPKAQKDSQLMQLFALLGCAGVKAASKHVDEMDVSCLTNTFLLVSSSTSTSSSTTAFLSHTHFI